jgi:hypothetical protein
MLDSFPQLQVLLAPTYETGTTGPWDSRPGAGATGNYLPPSVALGRCASQAGDLPQRIVVD